MNKIPLCVLLALGLSIVSRASAGGQMLHGHVPTAVSHLQSLRPLAATNRLQLAMGLPLRNQGELTNLLQNIYNPASPDYRHFLTADEFAQRFGPPGNGL
jgi:kumamolisin